MNNRMSIDDARNRIQTTRLISLDVFRGITIALMILVNCPGNNHPYPWLEHANWHGCRLADLVFPFFIFILGVSLVFSVSKALEKGQTRPHIFAKIAQRSVLIFAIGLFLNAFPYHFDFASLRIFGVLQRIALCYFVAATVYLCTDLRTQTLIMFTLLVGYGLLMCFYPTPYYGAGQLNPDGNLAAYLDRLLFSPEHLYGKTFDPEGLLSTLPAIASALLGNLTGAWLLQTPQQKRQVLGLFWAGLVALGAGWVWGIYFPINKTLWTSSYVLWTGGLALIFLALCHWLIAVKQRMLWAKPFEIFGLNATAAYILHVFFLKLQLAIPMINPDGQNGNVRSFFTQTAFGFASTENAALLYALCYTLFWLGILTILYRRKIFIRL